MNKYLEDAYFCTHGFAFIYKGFNDYDCKCVLAVHLRDEGERAFLILRGDEVHISDRSFKSKEVFNSFKQVLEVDKDLVLEVRHA